MLNKLLLSLPAEPQHLTNEIINKRK